ncbi:MAG: hypothetical protein OXU25_01240 [Thaumarchaeota archaeon]|nr:hypothetical protein [Nitrososphaerota archaeon]
MAKVQYPYPFLADNAKTVEFMLKDAKGEEDMAWILQWGRDRAARTERLARFVGILEERGLINSGMEDRLRHFVIQHCAAIAARHGFDMGYSYHDSESGPLAGLMSIDLHAVRPARAGEKPEPFADDAARSAFLAEVVGKSPEELGRVAREAVIEEMRRIYD